MSLDAHLKNPQYTFDATSGTINFVSEDITTIEKTVSGKVVFFKGTQPILAIHEESDVALDYAEGYVYIITQGKFLYRFSFYGLTDMDGKSYTALSNTDFASYQGKLRDVYEDLNTLVLVGCCDCGGGGSSNVLFYDDFESFPAEGAVDFLYVDKATPSIYIWNGVDAYVMIAGAGVESVTAGDDITIGGTATDPTVGVTPHTFVRRAGTEVGFPITGDLEVGTAFDLFYGEKTTPYYSAHNLDDQVASHIVTDGTYVTTDGIEGVNSVQTSSTDPSFKGRTYAADYSANFTARSLIDLNTMKSRIWTKAGTPDTGDDTNDGYLVGSLIWDTTNSKMYECTDNTAGAAVWETAIKNKYEDFIRGGGAIGSATTRYFCQGVELAQTSNKTTIASNSLYTTYRFLLAAAQSGADFTMHRDFYLGGSIDTSQTVVVANGSAAGIYDFSGTPFDASVDDFSVSFRAINGSGGSTQVVVSIQSNWQSL